MTESMRWEITIRSDKIDAFVLPRQSPAKRDLSPIGVTDGDDFSLGIDYHERTNAGRKLVDSV
jgi:hypothetical protein